MLLANVVIFSEASVKCKWYMQVTDARVDGMCVWVDDGGERKGGEDSTKKCLCRLWSQFFGVVWVAPHPPYPLIQPPLFLPHQCRPVSGQSAREACMEG